MEINNPKSSKIDRKFIERNRRIQMKALYCKLNSLVPNHSSRHDAWGLNLQEAKSLPDQLDEAENYIKSIKANLERMKERKDSLMGLVEKANTRSRMRRSRGPKSLQIKIQEMGSSLVIALKTGFNSPLIFNETIRILHEERADVVNASFSSVDDNTILHTIHLTIGESEPDYRAARISERLKKFVHDADAYDKY